MEWNIVVSKTYADWFLTLTDAEQVDVLAMVNVLQFKGPQLGRPYADTLHGSSHIINLKELRIQHAGKPYRVLYVFDPQRNAVLLCGGRKDGAKSKNFYQRMITIAEREYQNYLTDDVFKE